MKTLTSATMILDSIISGVRVTTMKLYFPERIHKQLNTYRVFSKSASSRRAIPYSRIKEDAIFIPSKWFRNGKGMSPTEEITDAQEIHAIDMIHYDMQNYIRSWCEELVNNHNLCKEQVNAYLSPWLYTTVLVTSTEWDNFFDQRLAQEAQQEIRELAEAMKACLDLSEPIERGYHIPYAAQSMQLNERFIQSVARCARVSYNNFSNGGLSTLEDDKRLYKNLINKKHWSPFEHQAMTRTALRYDFSECSDEHKNKNLSGNFREPVIQYRQIIQKCL